MTDHTTLCCAAPIIAIASSVAVTRAMIVSLTAPCTIAPPAATAANSCGPQTPARRAKVGHVADAFASLCVLSSPCRKFPHHRLRLSAGWVRGRAPCASNSRERAASSPAPRGRKCVGALRPCPFACLAPLGSSVLRPPPAPRASSGRRRERLSFPRDRPRLLPRTVPLSARGRRQVRERWREEAALVGRAVALMAALPSAGVLDLNLSASLRLCLLGFLAIVTDPSAKSAAVRRNHWLRALPPKALPRTFCRPALATNGPSARSCCVLAS